jgi:hypothetical protein
MKKVLYLFTMFSFLFLFAGCVSERYANKVNKAAKNNEHYSYSEVIDDLGDATIDATAGGKYATGIAVWVKGCDDLEEAHEKYEDGKKLYSLTITFTAGKAVSATWSEWQPE